MWQYFSLPAETSSARHCGSVFNVAWWDCFCECNCFLNLLEPKKIRLSMLGMSAWLNNRTPGSELEPCTLLFPSLRKLQLIPWLCFGALQLVSSNQLFPRQICYNGASPVQEDARHHKSFGLGILRGPGSDRLHLAEHTQPWGPSCPAMGAKERVQEQGKPTAIFPQETHQASKNLQLKTS